VMNVCGITTWGQTGYKVLDEAKRLIDASAAKRAAAAKSRKLSGTVKTRPSSKQTTTKGKAR